MVERRKLAVAPVERKRPKETPAEGKLRRKAERKAERQQTRKVNGDGRKNNGKHSTGRPPGTPNKIPRDVKEALFTAIEMLGSDGKGKDGVMGWFKMLARKKDERHLIIDLLKRCIPTKITGPSGGAIQVMQFSMTPDHVRNMSVDELELMQKILPKLTGEQQGHMANGADPSLYAKQIGYEIVEEKVEERR